MRHHHHHHHHLDLSASAAITRPDEAFAASAAASAAVSARHLPPTISPPAVMQRLQQATGRLQSASNSASASTASSASASSNGNATCHEQEQVNRFLMDMARLREPVCDLDIRDTGVYAKTHLPRGTRYGPFPMRLCQQPSDRHLAWEVSQPN